MAAPWRVQGGAMETVEAKNVTKLFDSVRAVDGIDLTAQAIAVLLFPGHGILQLLQSAAHGRPGSGSGQQGSG